MEGCALTCKHDDGGNGSKKVTGAEQMVEEHGQKREDQTFESLTFG